MNSGLVSCDWIAPTRNFWAVEVGFSVGCSLSTTSRWTECIIRFSNLAWCDIRVYDERMPEITLYHIRLCCTTTTRCVSSAPWTNSYFGLPSNSYFSLLYRNARPIHRGINGKGKQGKLGGGPRGSEFAFRSSGGGRGVGVYYVSGWQGEHMVLAYWDVDARRKPPAYYVCAAGR